MSIQNPPIFNTSIFNDLAFDNYNDGLNLDEADNRYLKLTGGILTGTLSLKDNLYISRTTNGEALTLTNGTVNVGLHLLSSSFHLGSTTNHNFNLQANNSNVLQIRTDGDISVLNGGVITSTNIALNASNPSSSSNYQIRIDSVSGNIDLRNNNSTNSTLLSLWSNGKRQLTCINNNDIVNIVNHNGSTAGLSLNGTLITSTAAELNILDGVTATAAELNILNGVTATAVELNYLSGITLGSIIASKAITVDASSNINSILRLTKSANGSQLLLTNGTSTGNIFHNNNGTIFFGTTSSHDLAFQTSGTVRCTISSAGLMNIQGGLQISGATITATAAQLNYNDITAIGVAEASKALVVDSNRDISNIRNLTATTSLIVSSGTTPLNLTNATSSSNYQVRIDSVSGNIDLRNNNATNSTLLSLWSNGKRQLTCINNNDIVNIVNHNGSTAGLSLNGTLITSTAAELNILDGVTATTAELNYNDITTIGTAEASKALVVDSNRDITNIRNLTTTDRLMLSSTSSSTLLGTTTAQNYGLCLFTNANSNMQATATGISFLNSASDAIPHASIFMERISSTSGDLILASRSTTNNISEVLRCRDAGNILVNTSKNQTNQGVITGTGSSNFVDGSYNVTLSTFSANGTNNFQIQQENGADAFIGTKSNHAFALMTNNTRAMTITTAQRIGVGTSSPSTLLHINGSVSNTISTGTYAQGSNSSYGTSNLAPVTFSNSLRTSSSIYCQGDVYVFSDKRIKKNIEFVDENYADAFYDNIKVCKFNYKNQEENHNKSLGLIAQDVIKSNYIELINMVENPEIDADDDGNFKGLVLNVAYEKISMINFIMIKKLMNRINKLEEIISNLDIVEE